MTTLLAEQPLIVSIMLGALAAGLFYGWLQTGKKLSAIFGMILLLLIPLAWMLASAWETDNERIELMIYEVADAVEQNDHDRALRVIADATLRERGRAELKNWTFAKADVNKIQSIKILSDAFPHFSH